MPDDRPYLPMFTQYFNTTDYPGQHVVRETRVYAAGRVEVDPEALTFPDLESLHVSMMSRGLVFLVRSDADPAVVKGVWL